MVLYCAELASPPPVPATIAQCPLPTRTTHLHRMSVGDAVTLGGLQGQCSSGMRGVRVEALHSKPLTVVLCHYCARQEQAWADEAGRRVAIGGRTGRTHCVNPVHAAWRPWNDPYGYMRVLSIPIKQNLRDVALEGGLEVAGRVPKQLPTANHTGPHQPSHELCPEKKNTRARTAPCPYAHAQAMRRAHLLAGAVSS